MKYQVIKKSEYKGVALVHDRKMQEFWLCSGQINGISFMTRHDKERDAAVQYDKNMIMAGKEPVNIFKRK
jgi:hypothetical protein